MQTRYFSFDFKDAAKKHFGLLLILVIYLFTFSTGVASQTSSDFLMKYLSGSANFHSLSIVTYYLVHLFTSLFNAQHPEFIANCISGAMVYAAVLLCYLTLRNLEISRSNAQISLLIFCLSPPIWQFSSEINEQSIFLLCFSLSLFLFSKENLNPRRLALALISLVLAYSYSDFLSASNLASDKTVQINFSNFFIKLVDLFKQAHQHNGFLIYFGLIGLCIGAVKALSQFKLWKNASTAQYALLVFLCIYTFSASLGIFYLSRSNFNGNGFALGYMASLFGLAFILQYWFTRVDLKAGITACLIVGVISLQAEHKPSIFTDSNPHIQGQLEHFLAEAQQPATIYIEGQEGRVLEFLVNTRYTNQQITVVNQGQWRWEHTFKRQKSPHTYFREIPPFLSKLELIEKNDFFELGQNNNLTLSSFEIDQTIPHSELSQWQRTGLNWDAESAFQFKHAVIIELEQKRRDKGFSILLDNNDTYRLYYVLDDNIFASSFIGPNTSQDGMTPRDIQVPQEAINKGFNRVILEATSGDKRYSIGYLRFKG